MALNDRIEQILKDKKLQAQVLADKIGMSKQTFSQRMTGKTPWTVAELEDICDASGYSLNWLIQGYGPELESDVMEALENKKAGIPMVNETEPGYSTKRIPFYDVEATGGTNGGDVSAVSAPTGTIDIGDILRDSEAAIRMAGNSMMPGYPPGCVLGLIPKRNKSIIPGEVYVYEDEDGRHCKRLFYKDDDPTSDTYICYSDTTTRFESGPRKDKLFYPPYELKISAIVRLFTVTGVVKRNTNGVINYKRSN